MDVLEWSQKLDGRKIGNEMSREEEKQAKTDGVVVVYGASDDLCELCGAIYDEIGCDDGGTIEFLGRKLKPQNECDNENCPNFVEETPTATIEALWCNGDVSWTYQTDIPHEKFRVYEREQDPKDGAGLPGVYCIGIVFSIKALRVAGEG